MIVQLLLGGLVLISSVNGKSIRYFQPGTDFGQDPVCGYESCNKLNPDAEYHIHLVPHSHDDVGWLKTVDQVSFGEKVVDFERILIFHDEILKRLFLLLCYYIQAYI
jgi:hypothetical protein